MKYISFYAKRAVKEQTQILNHNIEKIRDPPNQLD